MAFESNERPSHPISKFESMLKTDDVYFFDADDFEDIIHHYLNNGKIALAKKAIKIGLQQHTLSVPLKLLEVEVLVFENSLDRAEQILDELQLLDGNNEEVYIQRANIHSKKDEHQTAVELLYKALELSDDCFDVYSLLGMEYLFMDNYELAKDNFLKCLDIDDHDYASLYNVIYCFEYLEDFDTAIHFLNDYLDRNPYSEVAWHQLGKQYICKKMWTEAITAFDFAIISDETFIGAYFERGKVMEKLGRYAEAIENYETTIRIEDPTSHAYLRLGRCHEKLGHRDLAKNYYYQTVQEDPLLDKGWLAITHFYIKEKNYKKALYYINKALNIDAENAPYWKLCAKIHMALKNYGQAHFSLKQAVGLGDHQLETWLQWADTAIHREHFTNAIAILREGQEHYPHSQLLLLKLAGGHLMANDQKNAQKILTQVLGRKFDVQKIKDFKKEFGPYLKVEWIDSILSKVRGTSQ